MGTRRERMAIDAVGSSDRFFSFPPPLRQVRRRSMAPSHCAGRVARSFLLLLSSALCFFPGAPCLLSGNSSGHTAKYAHAPVASPL